MPIKFSISGIRGKYHELTPDRVVQFGRAFATYIGGGDVIVGMDARPSGKFISEAVVAGLTSSGSNVYDYGIMPTPILQWIVRHSKFDGGVSITAGHNSFSWNSLIFLTSDGSYLNHIQGDEFFNLHHSGDFEERAFNKLGKYCKTENYLEEYFNALRLKTSDGGGGSRKLKFVIDCANGFPSAVVRHLSEALGIHGIPIFCSEDGFMEKDPEPSVENAAFLGTFVRETGSDGGFVLNSDASRVLVVDETGTPLSEELTLPIFTKMVLDEEKRGDVVTNYSTSMLIDGVAERYGSRVFRTDVGQPYVIQMVKDLKALIGGEGNGSVVYTPFSYGLDAFIFIKKMVEYLRKRNCTISSIASGFTRPKVYKETLYLPPNKIYSVLERLGNLYTKKRILKDGYYIEKSDGWLCIRASATVSMIRIVGEGRSICDDIDRFKEIVG